MVLAAIAREAKREPLAEAASDYLKRAGGIAPQLGLKGPESRFIQPGKGSDPAREAEALRVSLKGKAVLLDERGEAMSSPEIAALIERERDQGTPELAFCIGGADGFDKAFRAEVQASGGRLLSFGRAVWPHALCRTMLAEQLYRSLAILTNHPYHRGG
nr:23S rRNA (pseudouridine(1915)-N(3))-methyltransferase RlmH [Parvularcula maris]